MFLKDYYTDHGIIILQDYYNSSCVGSYWDTQLLLLPLVSYIIIQYIAAQFKLLQKNNSYKMYP